MLFNTLTDRVKKYAGAVKKLFHKKGTRIALFALSGVLAIAAIAFAWIQWQEGNRAADRAADLLAESGLATPSLTGSADPQPDEEVATPESEAWEAEVDGYTVIARLDIDTLDVHLPVLSETSTDALKVSVCYYYGPSCGEDGNLVITGHDYKSGAHFGRLKEIGIGDAVTITGPEGNVWGYTVYELEHITPDDAQALDETSYSRELTLMTCEKDGNGRLLVRCRAD